MWCLWSLVFAVAPKLFAVADPETTSFSFRFYLDFLAIIFCDAIDAFNYFHEGGQGGSPSHFHYAHSSPEAFGATCVAAP